MVTRGQRSKRARPTSGRASSREKESAGYGEIKGGRVSRPKEVIWRDKERYFGRPIGFTEYILTENSLVIETGMLSKSRDVLMLYRIHDMRLIQGVTQKMFGVGSIILYTSDVTDQELVMKDIANPDAVMDLLTDLVSESRREHGVRTTEIGGVRGGLHGVDDYTY